MLKHEVFKIKSINTPLITMSNVVGICWQFVLDKDIIISFGQFNFIPHMAIFMLKEEVFKMKSMSTHIYKTKFN